MIFDFQIQAHGDYAIILLNGNLIDKGQAVSLLEQCEGLKSNACHKWAFNLEKLEYMNSSGLNTLIQLLTKARVGGGEAVIYNLNKKMNELILITKLHTLFKMATSEKEALALLGVND